MLSILKFRQRFSCCSCCHSHRFLCIEFINSFIKYKSTNSNESMYFRRPIPLGKIAYGLKTSNHPHFSLHLSRAVSLTTSFLATKGNILIQYFFYVVCFLLWKCEFCGMTRVVQKLYISEMLAFRPNLFLSKNLNAGLLI